MPTKMSENFTFHFNGEPISLIEPFRTGWTWVKIEKVIYNEPATIVIWSDGEKTVVKCGEDEPFDPEKGLAMAICKRVYGNTGHYNDEIHRWSVPYTEAKVEKELKKRREEFVEKLNQFHERMQEKEAKDGENT